MTLPARDKGHKAQGVANISFWLTVLVLIQYVLGIAYNLYGTAPTTAKAVGVLSSPLLALHVIVGTLLILSAVYLLVRSVRVGSRLAVITSAAALLALVGAWASGSAFIRGGQSGLSMTMAAMTAVALLCYLVNMRAFSAHEGHRSDERDHSRAELP